MNKPYSNKRIVTELNELNDVEIINPSDTDTLSYNGTKWTNSTSIIPYSVTTNNINIANIASTKSVRIGCMLGEPIDDNVTTVAIGNQAGSVDCSEKAVCIGSGAGVTNRGSNSVAIGFSAGATKSSTKVHNTTAIGSQAGQINQGESSVAIGFSAGVVNLAANSIVINATGSTLNNSTASALIIKPIRQVNKGFGNINGLYYNSTTGEITWSAT